MLSAVFHIEWWDDLSGREVVLRAVRAAGTCFLSETVCVITPSVLDVTPDGQGEMDVWFTVGLRGPAWRQYSAAVNMIRRGGQRVKTAGLLPADVDPSDRDAVLAFVFGGDGGE